MDIATIIGLVVGMACLLVEMAKDLKAYVVPAAMIIVFIGTPAAVIITVPMSRFMALAKISLKTLLVNKVEPTEVIKQLVQFGEIARRDGILALEGVIGQIKDGFLVKGIQMAVDGSDPEVIEEAMATELLYMENRHKDGIAMVRACGVYAPALGLIGTLIGLVAMLGNLQDSSIVGPSMAVSLVCTLYGAVVANMIFLPLADKLENLNKEEVWLKEIIMHGVMSIQSGDNPKIVAQKLKQFLPPKMRGE